MKNDQAESIKEYVDYVKIGFEPVLTEDGSYTLKQTSLEEEMHARGGAVSESYFIYYEALKSFFLSCKEGDSVEVISVGTGMGYNEVLTAAALLESKVKIDLSVQSYEKEDVLIELFKKRFLSLSDFPYFWSTFSKIDLDSEKIAEILKAKVDFHSSFDEEALSKIKSSKKIILFDAYSNKTSEELWSEDFLKSLMAKCLKGSYFTTYAATGVLNRSLKSEGFKDLKRDGFLYKRESTLAVKE